MADMSPYDEDDLSPNDDEALRSDGIVIPPTAGGKRTVSAAFLTPPASHASLSSGSSTNSTASVRYMKVTPSGRNLGLPVRIDSVDTVEFIGFTTQAAQDIHASFSQRPDRMNNPDDLIDFALSRVNSVHESLNMSDRAAMTRMGLNEQIQDAILDPLHSNVYYTETLKYWVRDTIEINWKTLLQLKSKLKAAAVRSRGKKPKTHVEKIFSAEAGPSQQPSTQQATATVQSTIGDLSSEEHSLPKAHVSLATGPRTDLPDHYTLWKGKAACEMADWIRSDGTIEITRLSSYSGGDFNFNNVAYYWTLERETAEIYCAYAARRCMFSEIWLFQVQVPKSFIDSLTTKSLFYGPDWKSYVWHCKKKMKPRPNHSELWQDAVDMIRGHICSSHSSKIMRVASHEIQEKITEDDVMVLDDGRKATQWALMKYETAERFATEINGKIHIEIRAPLHSTA